MKNYNKIIYFIIAFILLSGCIREPLKFRNLLEADQYIRKNISNLEWNEFSQLLTDNHNVSQEEFNYLKKILSSKYSSSHIEVNKNKLYRFNEEQNLLYMTIWEKKKGILFLKDISFIPKTNK